MNDCPQKTTESAIRGRLAKAQWALPYAALAMPAWLAWHSVCRVPWADHWTVLVEPWLRLRNGGSWGQFIHAANNDSRHDVPRLIHGALMEWAGWDLRLEAMICVGLAAVLVWLSNRLWQRHPAGEGTRLGMACFSALLIASPMQWMNWTWGIQICCLMAVAGALGAVVVLLTGRRSLTRRALAAGVLAGAASFSFVNGWLAWMVGSLALLAAPGANPRGERRRAALVWSGMLALTVALYAADFGTAPPPTGAGTAAHEGLAAGVLGRPLAALTFFLKVAGATFSEVWFWPDRLTRVTAGAWVASAVAVGGLVLACWLAVRWWSRRRTSEAAAMLPWLLLVLYGLANSAAIAAARFRMPDYSPFQSRYPSYTQWWLIGLMSLVLLLPARHLVRRLFPLGMAAAAWCWLCGAWQGWADDQRIGWHSRNAEAAVALRHVAMEPYLLHRLFPEGAAGVPGGLEALDAAGLLNVKTFRRPETEAAPRMKPGRVDGQLLGGKWEDGWPLLRGWAMDMDRRTEARAILVSFRAEGAAEEWLGVATHRTREPLHAKRRRARALEDRIGWRFAPPEAYPLAAVPAGWMRRAVPPGRVTFRAWAFDAVAGTVHPLRGEVVLDVPAPADSEA